MSADKRVYERSRLADAPDLHGDLADARRQELIAPDPIRERTVRIARPRVRKRTAGGDQLPLQVDACDEEQCRLLDEGRHELRPVDEHRRSVLGDRGEIFEYERESQRRFRLELVRHLFGRPLDPELIERPRIFGQPFRVSVGS